MAMLPDFEERQNRLKALRNRQDLFQEEASTLGSACSLLISLAFIIILYKEMCFQQFLSTMKTKWVSSLWNIKRGHLNTLFTCLAIVSDWLEVWVLINVCGSQGMIALILETIDKCSQWKSMRHLAHLIGEESAARWNDMINYLYLLLGGWSLLHNSGLKALLGSIHF